VLGVIRQRILEGIYPPNSQLKPEDQLAAEFGVSRATIRQAMGELLKEGLVDRRQGRGTFVLPTGRPYSQRFYGSLADVIAESRGSRSLNTEFEHGAQIPIRIAAALGLEEPVGTVVRRNRAVKDQIFAYAINYLPSEFGRLLTAGELRKVGLIALLATKGVRFGGAQQLIRAEQADIEICERLQMDLAAPVLYAERLVVDIDEKPVQFGRTWYRADLFAYRVNLRVDGDAGTMRLDLDQDLRDSEQSLR
jgi:GntR family transcriptional regulator